MLPGSIVMQPPVEGSGELNIRSGRAVIKMPRVSGNSPHNAVWPGTAFNPGLRKMIGCEQTYSQFLDQDFRVMGFALCEYRRVPLKSGGLAEEVISHAD